MLSVPPLITWNFNPLGAKGIFVHFKVVRDSTHITPFVVTDQKCALACMEFCMICTLLQLTYRVPDVCTWYVVHVQYTIYKY